MRLRDIPAFVIAILLPQAAGALGAYFTTPAISGWYATLAKPVLMSPAWIFAPVWTVLYLMMGIAAFIVWRTGRASRQKNDALGVFVLQLAVNTMWSIVFFGMRDPGASLITIASLGLAIIATIIAFARISKTAAWLLAPYLAWVIFAAYLNYMIFVLN